MNAEDEYLLYTDAFRNAFAKTNDLEHALRVIRERGAIYLISIRVLKVEWKLGLHAAMSLVDFSATWSDRHCESMVPPAALPDDYPPLINRLFHAFVKIFREGNNVELGIQELQRLGATEMESVSVVKAALGLNSTQAIALVSLSAAWREMQVQSNLKADASATAPSLGNRNSFGYPTLNKSYLDAFMQIIRSNGGYESALQAILALGATYLDAILVVQAGLRRDLNGADDLLSSSTTYGSLRPIIEDFLPIK